jgi:hypothetical protein
MACPECKVVVTLTGRLETRDHFEVNKIAVGPQFPVGFDGFVARLIYGAMNDIKAVPRVPGELEQEMEARRSPYAVRAEPSRSQ